VREHSINWNGSVLHAAPLQSIVSRALRKSA
jgi:hypothetical protein